MKTPKLFYIILLPVLSMALCGCPPLSFKMYVRNNTTDTAHLTVMYILKKDSLPASINLKLKDSILKISNKLYNLLDLELPAIRDGENMTLAIPPRSTVNISDLLSSYPMFFADKTLIISSGTNSDTMKANYAFRQLLHFRRKRDRYYNYFYRTLLYYDIR